jgi:hypothetical protein
MFPSGSLVLGGKNWAVSGVPMLTKLWTRPLNTLNSGGWVSLSILVRSEVDIRCCLLQAAGVAGTSFVDMNSEEGMSEHDADIVKWAAASIYFGKGDT